MNVDDRKLSDDPEELKKVISSYQEKVEYLEQKIRLLQIEIFGRKSEKRPLPDTSQLRLFEEPRPEAPVVEERIVVPSHSRRKRGRKPLPENLPRVEVIHDLDESEKTCDCGCKLKCIGEEVSEKLDYVPARIQVERHIRCKYACPACEGVDSQGPTVRIAPVPAQLLPKSIATSGLVAHIITAKFEDALPFYRQEKIFARLGIDLGRASMAGWVIKTYEKVQPLIELLGHEIRSGPIVGIDETPLQVLNEPGRENTTKSYMWVFRGGDPDRPTLVYQYHPTRSGKIPLAFLKGYQGFVQTDGYNGYDALGRQPGVTLVGCWAHARRKFDKVIKARGNPCKTGAADEAMAYIGKLYAVEKEARQKGLSPDQIYELRQHRSKPILDEFKKWLDHKIQTTPPKGLLGKAVGYTLNHWSRLVRYIDDGRLRPDNNMVENAIRPFVLGRKNWLFNGHPSGAEASAAMFSLIETARANGLKSYYYLRYLFDRLPLVKTEADLKSLLPQHVNADALGAPIQ